VRRGAVFIAFAPAAGAAAKTACSPASVSFGHIPQYAADKISSRLERLDRNICVAF